MLNRYFDRMTEVIQNRCGGYLNKFLGDGIFAFFGAPVPDEDHRDRAIRAALDCQREVCLLNEALAEETGTSAVLRCRIGVTTGEVMVGNCGSTQRMDYTAIGDSVNLASRLESANKFFGTRILILDQTLAAASADGLVARPLGKVIVAGKNEPVEVWDVLAGAEEAPDEFQKSFADFARAVELMTDRKFAAVAELLEAVLKVVPDDRPAQIYLQRCKDYLAAPPARDWDGSLRLTEK